VGHQMRVFAGGSFLNEDKKKIPSIHVRHYW
jgi:hypothetical protein